MSGLFVRRTAEHLVADIEPTSLYCLDVKDIHLVAGGIRCDYAHSHRIGIAHFRRANNIVTGQLLPTNLRRGRPKSCHKKDESG